MGFSVDFTDVESTGFEAIDAGNYLVAVTDWSETEVKNAGGKLDVGTPGINWEFTIQDGKYENRRLWTNHWLAPTALGFLKTFLKATGKVSDEDLDGQLDFDPDDIVGSQLVLKVTKRQYKDDWTNDVKGYKPADTYKGASGEATSSMMP